MGYVGNRSGSVQGRMALAPRALASTWRWCVVAVLLCRSAVHASICPSAHGISQEGRCVCTSDIISCSALGLRHVPRDVPTSVVTLDLSHNHIVQLQELNFRGLCRLETLRLANNQLTSIQLRAFGNSSGTLLRHLDLSSNQLRVLQQHYFQEVPGLEELLLFNNRIIQVEGTAFTGLTNLRKAYLSHNRLTDFPFFSIREHTHPHLYLLDLSSNRLPRLPLEDISNLPTIVQNGLYLHNNSLVCECSMYGLFRHWLEKEFDSVKDFKPEHTCLVFGIQKGPVRLFQRNSYFEKCNFTEMQHPLNTQKGSVSISAGKTLWLHCVTALHRHHVTFFWVSPKQEYIASPGNDRLKMYTNGTLKILEANAEDSGVYWCMALNQQQQRNETQEVNVTVVLPNEHQSQESFNTGFTTLLGCVVSLLLVLMYLYLTPCRCPSCPNSPPPPTAKSSLGNEAAAGSGSGQSAILTPTPPMTTEGPGRKVSTNKHVVFLEPIREHQNGRLRAGPVQGHLGMGLLQGAEQQSKLNSQSQQRAGETDSIMSVFSDTPIMLP